MCRRVVACYLLTSLAALACLTTLAAVAARSLAERYAVEAAAPRSRSSVRLPGWFEVCFSPWQVAGQAAAVLVLAGGAAATVRWLRVPNAIDVQLRRAASRPRDGLRVDLVLGSGPAAVGWNRLVEAVSQASELDGLHARLGDALEKYRSRHADAILDCLPEGVAVTDHLGRVTFANPTCLALLPLRDQQDEPLEGSLMVERLSAEAARADIAPLLADDGRERNTVVELPRFDASGDSVLRVARHPLRAAGGQAAGSHIWSLRNVTQQKLAEKMHTEFVNSATHELRTPMANIKAYAETLAGGDELDVEEQKEFCNIINSEVSRLSRLIDDLLSIESMEVGSLALARQETDVERLIREKVEMARPLMDKKQLAFQVSLPEKLPNMHLDKDKLALALDNLLGNAAKYTPPGGEVSLRVDVDEHALQIHVQDSGLGIAEDELPKVFDKFYRSSDPRVQAETGTGLGLAMVREIVHLHGGQVDVRSRLDEGSMFSITLPMG